jgi:hypothetical protein
MSTETNPKKIHAARASRLRRLATLLIGIAFVVAWHVPAWSAEQSAETDAKQFASPEEATEALIAAMKADSSEPLLAVLGKTAKNLVESGDPVADSAARTRFVTAYDEAHSLDRSQTDKVVVVVGKNEWPFPIPLVKSDSGWSFDTDAGMEELIDRRIGRNELSAMQVCLAYVDAQREYYSLNPEKDSLNHYAQRIASTEGKHDGLFWQSKPGEPESPLGPLIARARGEGYEGEGKQRPYHGYRYKILTAQGPDAPGGAYDYVVPGGKMIGGFALVAYPARYARSGVMTFIVNHEGVVYEKDLGPETEAEAAKMVAFNPDSSWKPAKPD